jgi:hypothetical protein
MASLRDYKYWFPTVAFIFAFIFIPVTQLEWLDHMPGDIGDARLNNYFLENIFQFLRGSTDSLWHMYFFFPFPYVIGFSDNLFGTSPVYVLVRFLGLNTDTAFQIWFLFGYIVNFVAAFYALRLVGVSSIASTIGALIFAFALPTSAHAWHAQLHYRFGLPLALVFFSSFLNTKAWRNFLVAGLWTVWQFFAGVYIGFFTLFLLATMTLTYLGYSRIKDRVSFISIASDFILSWRMQSKYQITFFLSSLLLLTLLLVILFFPYLQVSHLYGAKRSWDEIAMMLPRPQSYLLADASSLWSNRSAQMFRDLPMRHEHQMFIGLIPLLLALVGFFIGSRRKNGPIFTLMIGMLGVSIAMTLYIGGLSLWYLFHKIPLASAIRAMTRIDQALLFPVAYLSAIAIDDFRMRFSWGKLTVLALIVPLLVSEAGLTSMGTSTKDSWRQRILLLDDTVPQNLPKDSVLFFAQRSGPPFADELDAMWVSLRRDKKTINGYSGLFPPGYDYEFTNDCSQLPKRILSFLEFSAQKENVDAYKEIMSRIVPIGFDNCDSSWWHSPS